MGQVVALKRGSVVKEGAVRETLDRPRRLAKDLDWLSLLRRMSAGDQSAVAELYDATSNLVFSLALRVLRERTAAEDVVVEVYAQVWEQARTYDPQRGTPLSWLLMLTRSRAIDLLRVRTRTQTVVPLESAATVLSAAPDPEENSVVAERRRVVGQALKHLSEEERQVIELAYFSDLNHSEIAACLGQPLGTVKTRLRTGLLRLKKLLGPLTSAAGTSQKGVAL
jgi:RNA polymerase sigma-70 factor (ECF subfamily)